jgi:hypothetical protein
MRRNGHPIKGRFNRTPRRRSKAKLFARKPKKAR